MPRLLRIGKPIDVADLAVDDTRGGGPSAIDPRGRKALLNIRWMAAIRVRRWAGKREAFPVLIERRKPLWRTKRSQVLARISVLRRTKVFKRTWFGMTLILGFRTLPLHCMAPPAPGSCISLARAADGARTQFTQRS